MSYLLFLDESGIDQRQSPYQVLAGVAVHDEHLWNLICRIQEAEIEHFGRRVSAGPLELREKTLLKPKTSRLAAQLPPTTPEQRRKRGEVCLEKGRLPKAPQPTSGATRLELTALAQ